MRASAPPSGALLCSPGQERPGKQFPSSHGAGASPSALFSCSNVICPWPLPGTQCEVYHFERIREGKWL